jgi:hypothetical protein
MYWDTYRFFEIRRGYSPQARCDQVTNHPNTLLVHQLLFPEGQTAARNPVTMRVRKASAVNGSSLVARSLVFMNYLCQPKD